MSLPVLVSRFPGVASRVQQWALDCRAVMNGFQLSGDIVHLIAILSLLSYIKYKRSCSGLSGKTQFLYAVVFTARYLDLAQSPNAYLTIMKVAFIVATYATLFFFYIYRKTYEYKKDSFWIEALVLPLIILAVFVNHYGSPEEIAWTFSIYLEAVAIVPQLYMIYTTGRAEYIIRFYMMCLVVYRLFYILNWIYKSYPDLQNVDPITMVSGSVQCAVFLVYFCIPKGQNPDAGYWANNLSLLRQKAFLANPFSKTQGPNLETVAVIGQEVPPSTQQTTLKEEEGRY